MSTEEKLEVLASALSKIAMGTNDALVSKYCVTILLEVGEEDRVKKLLSNYKNDPSLS